MPGRDYEVIVNPSGADPVVDRVGNAAGGHSHPFEAGRGVEQGHAPVRSRPPRVARRSPGAASGGAFAIADRAGSAVR